MNVYPNFSYIAKLMAEPTRATILDCLMNGQAFPASELAYMAKVSHPTISSHLAKLVEGNLLVMEHYGRHRYYRLASKEVAEVIEKLGTIAPPVEIRSLRQSSQLKQVRFGRTCYDHLAGELGVKVTEALIEKEIVYLEDGLYAVTKKGRKWFLQFGINIDEANTKRRIFAKPCLDWSERRYHISGWLGSTIATRFFENRWIIKTEKTRAVQLTPKGIDALKNHFGITIEKDRIN
ncbi:helix-turn-helix transcriptional regulator [Neobacillus sp. WH10]|uniref:ArsR/SmtB family transcription factor n=1 Tax=Neobacillus sp. WH10 TaxID=3047873 RepID=UPI0024C18360|nr:helix-turn-helix transcriptional regulator [Neobacillus sp. WH10]WHY78501.1 helix-turn-helix transcriptional regulator [Neobacillus sp. WH10]